MFAMHFPVAGIDINPLIPPLVGFLISFFTSMGGLSGAFLILPFQMSMLGFISPAVSPTNQIFNIIAIPGGVARYIKEGRLVLPLVWIVVIGNLPGILLGAYIRVRWLENPHQFKLFVGIVLLYMGVRLMQDYIKRRSKRAMGAEARFQKLARHWNDRTAENGEELPRTKVLRFDWRRVEYEFYGERFVVPVPTMLAISFPVGIIGGIYGIGGAAMIAPIYIAVFALPVYTVAGATLLGNFINSIAGVCFYVYLSALHPSQSIAPDWGLGILFGLGGLAGTYFGARYQKYFPANGIKMFLIFALIFLAGNYILF